MEIGLMTREEMLQESYTNKGNMYTTEEWEENGDYVITDRNGYLNYANGEEVIDENDLPEDGWYDCTGYNEDNDRYYDSGLYVNQYDYDDEW